jgi:leucine dehydrogenase
MKARLKSSASSSRGTSKSAKPKRANPARVAAAPRLAGGRSLDDGLFSLLAEFAHEQLSFAFEPASGYRGIIAIHDTTLGPALGGTRFWNYANDRDAVVDALRLARGMTYKAAVAGLNLGGGKSVIIGDNKTKDRRGIFRAHGRHVESLGGRYITAEDVGTGTADMEFIRIETKHVTGLASASGDPSPVTAFGVYRGIKACAKYRYGADALAGRIVAVQGVGHVGYHVCKLLHADGAKLVISDIDAQRVKRVVQEFGAKAVGDAEIYGYKANIFAPCALGAIINDRTLPQLKVDIVAGAANNQLAEERHGDALDQRGIVYAPDYVINGGGLINVYGELDGWSMDRAHDKAGEIYNTVLRVLNIARDQKIPTYKAADRLAEERIGEGRRRRSGPSGREL